MIDRNEGPSLGQSMIQHMEEDWYAVIREPIGSVITIQCRICPWSIRLNDDDMAQVAEAAAAFIAHAKRYHSKTLLRDKEVNVEKL